MSRHPADILLEAQLGAVAVPQLSTDPTLDLSLDLAGAYRIQEDVTQRRVAAGERLTGFKLGFTSRAKMAQMGVDEVIGGRLTSTLQYADGDIIDPATLIHPRIEPEVVFRLGRDVDDDESVESAVAAVDAVAAGLEVIDSRYADFQFSLADVVADNASAAGYAVGPWHRPPAPPRIWPTGACCSRSMVWWSRPARARPSSAIRGGPSGLRSGSPGSSASR